MPGSARGEPIIARMWWKAGVLSFAVLLGSRLLGLLRESALASAFGASPQGDAAVLLLTLPDWLASVTAGGALSLVLLPLWARQGKAEQAATLRRVVRALLVLGMLMAGLLVLASGPVARWLAPGAEGAAHALARTAVACAAPAVPLALLAALLGARLQHEQAFVTQNGANLVVNGVLVATIFFVAARGRFSTPLAPMEAVLWLAGGLLTAQLARLGWQAWHLGRRVKSRPAEPALGAAAAPTAPGADTWAWAVLATALPLTWPLVARSFASQESGGALAIFNYGYKLVELPLVLAVQLAASMSFPAITRAWHDPQAAQAAVRSAMAVAWGLACGTAAGLVVGAPAVAQLLFGWGRMDEASLRQIAALAAIGAWSLPAQALLAVGMTVLAAQGRLGWGVAAHALGLAMVAVLGWLAGDATGPVMMQALVVASWLAAGVVVWGMVAEGHWPVAAVLPVWELGAPLTGLAASGVAMSFAVLKNPNVWAGLVLALFAMILTSAPLYWINRGTRSRDDHDTGG